MATLEAKNAPTGHVAVGAVTIDLDEVELEAPDAPELERDQEVHTTA
jgi:hypothetical protein